MEGCRVNENLYFFIYGVEKTVFERFGAVQKHRAGHTNLFRRSFTRLGLTRHQEVHFQCSSSRRRRSSSSGKEDRLLLEEEDLQQQQLAAHRDFFN
jgi:hypothetical protein